MKRISMLISIIVFLYQHSIYAQNQKDSVFLFEGAQVMLTPVVVNAHLNVTSFIQRIKDDTSFYKAFKNLRVIEYSAIHDIRMLGKKESVDAMYHARTQQYRRHGCRFMRILEEEIKGNYFDKHNEPRSYTGQMYASLFFTKDSVCHETNIIGNLPAGTAGKSGLEKHKEQLKMLFFNPGKKIKGLPFISNKTAIFEKNTINCYDLFLNWETYKGKNCLVLRQKVKESRKDDVILDEMNTWFEDSSYNVLARTYSLSYNAGVYDFNVKMEVEMTHFKDMLVPQLIRYYGDWKVMFKSRERGVFTATLFDFK